MSQDGQFAENGGMFPYMVRSLRKTLFNSNEIGIIEPNCKGWTVEHIEWNNPDNQKKKRQLNPPLSWNWIPGKTATGHLIGGCTDVLEFLKGTPFWPEDKAWAGAILFLENSEGAASSETFTRWLRNYGTMGILEKINGIIFARPGGNIPPEKFCEYDEALVKIVHGEFGRKDIPIVTNMDFGHTDPMFVIPYGAMAKIDCETKTFSILESGTL